MFGKFLLLFGLLPVLGGLVARKFLSDRVSRSVPGETMGLDGRELSERILKKGGVSEVEITMKRSPFLEISPVTMRLSPVVGESKELHHLAEAALISGLVLMARQQERVVAWRVWAIKFSTAFPAFLAVVVLFAMVVAKISVSLALGLLSASLGVTTIFLWLTLPVERAAASAVAEILRHSSVIPRRDDAEKLARLVKAYAWKRVIPGALFWMGR